jgi:hypothetical protein
MALSQNSQKSSIEDTKSSKRWWNFWKKNSLQETKNTNDKEDAIDSKKSSDTIITVKTRFGNFSVNFKPFFKLKFSLGCVCMSGIIQHWCRGTSILYYKMFFNIKLMII